MKTPTKYPIFTVFFWSKSEILAIFQPDQPVAIDDGHGQCESKMPVEKSAGMYVVYSFYYIYLFSI